MGHRPISKAAHHPENDFGGSKGIGRQVQDKRCPRPSQSRKCDPGKDQRQGSASGASKGCWHGGDQAFYEAWDSLHPDVADAIMKVALSVNPSYDVNNIVHKDPFEWLRERYPDVYAEMNQALEEAKEKNVSRESEESSETES